MDRRVRKAVYYIGCVFINIINVKERNRYAVVNDRFYERRERKDGESATQPVSFYAFLYNVVAAQADNICKGAHNHD